MNSTQMFAVWFGSCLVIWTGAWMVGSAIDFAAKRIVEAIGQLTDAVKQQEQTPTSTKRGSP